MTWHGDHAHHPRQGAFVEHAAAGAGLRGDGGDAAGVRHVPVVQCAGFQQEAEQARCPQVRDAGSDRGLRAVHAVPAEWSDEQIKKNESLNPVMVEFYRVMGYLPEALINYFGRLGWSLDDKTGDHAAGDDDREFRLRPRQHLAGQLRPAKAALGGRRVHDGRPRWSTRWTA